MSYDQNYQWPLVIHLLPFTCTSHGNLYFTHSTIFRKTRDELSHNIFLMLQECNKFREHQARELLIELLEKQLAERQGLLKDFRESIQKADELLK